MPGTFRLFPVATLPGYRREDGENEPVFMVLYNRSCPAGTFRETDMFVAMESESSIGDTVHAYQLSLSMYAFKFLKRKGVSNGNLTVKWAVKIEKSRALPIVLLFRMASANMMLTSIDMAHPETQNDDHYSSIAYSAVDVLVAVFVVGGSHPVSPRRHF
jgi:hypothetical protein